MRQHPAGRGRAHEKHEAIACGCAEDAWRGQALLGFEAASLRFFSRQLPHAIGFEPDPNLVSLRSQASHARVHAKVFGYEFD
jgi:hypothetical protein